MQQAIITAHNAFPGLAQAMAAPGIIDNMRVHVLQVYTTLKILLSLTDYGFETWVRKYGEIEIRKPMLKAFLTDRMANNYWMYDTGNMAKAMKAAKLPWKGTLRQR